MKSIYVVIFLSVTFFSCKNERSNQVPIDVEGTKINEVTNSSELAAAATDINYISLSEEIVSNIGNNCDYIDYIFYDLPISISQDNKEAIISSINFISREVPTSIPFACKPMGRKFFHIDGEIVLEADVYLNKKEGCFFYVFYENGKKTYANMISSDGVNFYLNVFGQAGIKQ